MPSLRYENLQPPIETLPFFPLYGNVAQVITPAFHWHDGIEFLYSFEGEGQFHVGPKHLAMKEGDLAVVNSRRIHYYSAKNQMSFCGLIVQKSFFTENGIDIDNITFCELLSDQKATEMIDTIYRIYRATEEPLYVPTLRHAVLTFILYVCKHYQYDKETTAAYTSKSYEKILSSLNYIQDYYAENISLDKIAAHVGYSKYHFAKLFKDATGQTFIDYLNICRCSRAKDLLKFSSMPITQICHEVGFNNCSYFTDTFKKIYGHTPREFRKLQKKQTVS